MRGQFMRTHFSKLLLICLCSTFILTACGSKDDNKAKDGNDTTVTSSPDKSDPGNSSTPVDPDDPAPTEFGKQELDLGDLDSETLTVYPKEKTNSMYSTMQKKFQMRPFSLIRQKF